jgi:hypothetical protein
VCAACVLALQDDRVEVIHMHAVDERVTPTALRGFHFDFEMEDADHDGVEDHPVSPTQHAPFSATWRV